MRLFGMAASRCAAVVFAGFFAVVGTAAAQTIKLGMTMPTKTLLGKQAVQAAELAVEMVNEKGGVLGSKLELIVYDDANSPVEGVAASQRLLDRDNVKFLMGQISSTVSLAILPVARSTGVIYMPMLPKHDAVTASGYNKLFRLGSTVGMDALVFNDYLSNQVRPSKLAYIGENSDYGRLLLSSVERALNIGTAKVVAYSGLYDLKQADFTALVTDARTSGADTLLTGGAIVEQYANILRSAAETGFRPRVIAVAPGTLNRRVIELAGRASEGVVSVDIYTSALDTPLNQEFVQRYKRKHGHEPENIEALAFEGPWLLAQAMAKAGTSTDVDRIASVLRAGAWEAPRGQVRFDGNGQAQSRAFVVQVKDGRVVRQ